MTGALIHLPLVCTYSLPSIGAGCRIHDDNGNKIIQTHTETCRHDIKEAIAETIFFAGEDTNVKTCDTTQAAMESSINAVTDILESF